MDILKSIKSTAKVVELSVKKHSPELCIVAGIGGGIAATVLACKATTKVSLIVEEKDKTMEIVRQSKESGEITTIEGIIPYTEKDAQQDTAKIYAQTGLKVLKEYTPAIIVGAASVTSILVGYNILNKRAITFAATATALDRAFKDYRKNVVERFGKKLDNELLYNIKSEEVTEEVTDAKTGKTKEIKKTVNTAYNPAGNIYSRIADPSIWNLENEDASEVRFHCLNVQNWANDKLHSVGYLSLNEVYDALGYPRTPEGQFAGWAIGHGDDFVDFGLDNIQDEKVRDFINGYESVVWLDFNCIPNFYEYIK